jgi:hypothetical protein
MAANVTMCIHMLASHRKKHMVSQIGHVSSWIIAFWLGYKSTIQACGTADGLICSCLQVWIMWILTPNYWTAQSSDPHPIERSIGYDFAQSICIYIYIYVQYLIWLVTTKKKPWLLRNHHDGVCNTPGAVNHQDCGGIMFVDEWCKRQTCGYVDDVTRNDCCRMLGS